jgi:TolB-like protein/DNA-binding winged helix-turn-helix (wHTH) protein/Tfp pilus assembly protein PilF
MKAPSPIFRFGPFESRPRTRELLKNGSRLKIRPQPLQILNLLLERAGDVVTREELRQELWTSDTFVDFERGLNSSVMELRSVLGDSAAKGRYIETVIKTGYRFIAPVEVVESPTATVTASADSAVAAVPETEAPEITVDPQPHIAAPNSNPHQQMWRRGIALATLIVLAAVLAYFQFWRPRERHKIAAGKITLAVLPFENLTGDPSQDYLSDGLTEEMIAQLGRLDPDRMSVIARASVMHYKNTPVQLPQIEHDLGVQYVLEGSVRRDADRVRINAQLIQLKDQVPLWSRQYDRQLSNLLTLQGEIAYEVGDEIQTILGDGSRVAKQRPTLAAPTTSYEAYDLYLKGRYFWNKRNPQGFRQAAEYFQLAIDKDPNYARAYAGLADTFALMSSYGYAPPAEFVPKARAAALKALQIDDSLAEAHASLAVIAQNYDWDWPTAEREYRRAIQLDPGYATAHQWYAECLGFQGRFDEAFAESERARKLDPLSLIISADYGALLYYSRQYDRSIAEFRRVLEMEPNFPRAYIVIFPLVEKGLFPEALADAQKWKQVVDSPWPAAVEVYVYARSGQIAEAQRSLQKLQHATQREFQDPAAMLMAHVALDNKTETFQWLQKCYDARSPLTTLKVDPMYDPLRSDPRFQKFLQDVHLTP